MLLQEMAVRLNGWLYLGPPFLVPKHHFKLQKIVLFFARILNYQAVVVVRPQFPNVRLSKVVRALDAVQTSRAGPRCLP